MSKNDSKTTLYLTPSVRKALKKRVIDTNQTMSEYVDRAVAYAIVEDLEDIEIIEERRGESTEELDEFLAALQKDGIIQS